MIRKEEKKKKKKKKKKNLLVIRMRVNKLTHPAGSGEQFSRSSFAN